MGWGKKLKEDHLRYISGRGVETQSILILDGEGGGANFVQNNQQKSGHFLAWGRERVISKKGFKTFIITSNNLLDLKGYRGEFV